MIFIRLFVFLFQYSNTLNKVYGLSTLEGSSSCFFFFLFFSSFLTLNTLIKHISWKFWIYNIYLEHTKKKSSRLMVILSKLCIFLRKVMHLIWRCT